MKIRLPFGAKKTGAVNAVVKGTPGDDASVVLLVTISGTEHDRYQSFLGVCGENSVELFNICEEEEFDEDESGFAFYFCSIVGISIVDVEDEQTLSSRMSTFDVAKVDGVTFVEIYWRK